MSSGSDNEQVEYARAPIVLVVEDDPFTRKMVGRRLHAAGYEVILVPDAADALTIAQRTPFHVMVLDLNLVDPNPFNGMHTGFAVLEWLHRQLGEFLFKIVIYTSQTDLPVMEKAEAAGVYAFCVKRRDMGNLVRCVNDAVQALAAEQQRGNESAA